MSVQEHDDTVRRWITAWNAPVRRHLPPARRKDCRTMGADGCIGSHATTRGDSESHV